MLTKAMGDKRNSHRWNRLTIGCLMLVGVLLSGCGNEPYVKQINEAHDILNQGKINNSQEILKQADEKYRKAYSYALFAIEKQYDALFNLGVLHAFSGEFQNCIEVLNRAYELRRDDPDLFYYWGMCHANKAKIALNDDSKRHDFDRGVQIYQLGLNLDLNNPKINYGLGILHGFIGDDHAKGVEYLNVAHQAHPEDINTLFALANLNYRLGKVEESIDFFSTIMRLSEPESSSYQKAKANLEKIR